MASDPTRPCSVRVSPQQYATLCSYCQKTHTDRRYILRLCIQHMVAAIIREHPDCAFHSLEHALEFLHRNEIHQFKVDSPRKLAQALAHETTCSVGVERSRYSEHEVANSAALAINELQRSAPAPSIDPDLSKAISELYLITDIAVLERTQAPEALSETLRNEWMRRKESHLEVLKEFGHLGGRVD